MIGEVFAHSRASRAEVLGGEGGRRPKGGVAGADAVTVGGDSGRDGGPGGGCGDDAKAR